LLANRIAIWIDSVVRGSLTDRITQRSALTMKAKAFALFLSGVAVGWLPAAEFDKPVMLKAGGKPIRVESPGYACPAWADLDGDGKPELLVGQFAKGKIKVLPHQGGLDFGEGAWLKAEQIDAEIPGVW
jgi:hypothetical protein